MDANKRKIAAHTVPFLVWVGVMALLQLAENFTTVPPMALPWSYALKTAACGALIVWLKPWQGDGSATGNFVRHLPLALLVGALVAALWILPETVWTAKHFPGFHAFYNKWLIIMPGTWPSYFDPAIFPELPSWHSSLMYSPEKCGWGLTVMKLVGTTLVIATAEEYFFRGFLYRWLQNADFTKISLKAYDAPMFWVVVAVFAIEHDRIVGGAMAGGAYGWLVLRTGGVRPAVVAHALTNFLLGLHVILSKQYGFW